MEKNNFGTRKLIQELSNLKKIDNELEKVTEESLGYMKEITHTTKHALDHIMGALIEIENRLTKVEDGISPSNNICDELNKISCELAEMGESLYLIEKALNKEDKEKWNKTINQ